MARTKISEFSSTPGNNTDIDNINIAEGCAPSGINNAIRELMAQLKDFQAGTAGDSFNGPIGTTTAAAGVFTTLSASGAFTYGGVTLSNAVTGTGNMVLSNSPTLVTPALGTPSSATLTNATGLPIATGVSGLGTGVATFLATPSSANLAAAVSDETGTGALVFANSPTLVTPALGTPSALVGTNITGTAANFNINGTVGATTANTGSFTTLATSGAVTHNAGTANGVAYLNGSKVLTTGSALTFNGTSLGVGSSSYGDAGTITASIGVPGTTTGGLQLWSTTSGQHFVSFGDGTSGTDTYRGYVGYAHASDALIFGASTAEQMRLTSTGLGIGNSSPTAKLDVTGTAAISGAVTLSGGTANGVAYLNGSKVLTTGSALTFAGTSLGINGASANILFDNGGAGGSALQLGTSGTSHGYIGTIAGNFPLLFQINSAEQMRLTSTGLGIGTSSPGDKLEIGGAGAGIILASPNGTRYRITVSNIGVLTVAAV